MAVKELDSPAACVLDSGSAGGHVFHAGDATWTALRWRDLGLSRDC